MNSHVALLRGINVGGNNKVKMTELKALFEAQGFSDVLTYINSGNVVFNAEGPVTAPGLEEAFRAAFGLEVPILLRGRRELLDLSSAIPAAWTNDAEQRTEVFFLWSDYDAPESLGLLKAVSGVDNVMYAHGAIVWNLQRADYKRSGLHGVIGTEIYRNMTARNVNTTRKLAELLQPRP